MADDDCAPVPEVWNELRTRRLVLVGDDGRDRAVLEIDHGQVELRLCGDADGPSVLLHAGTYEAGSRSAGIEWWYQGNAIGASVLVEEDGEVWLHQSGVGGAGGCGDEG